ncbi:phospholipase D-like domain-containing protein [Rubellimicrobium sp. CFH 75288]|uniref:phospholipase D family protein n=1 Tax=Rubellimicrobium sp. CFH 75288 TaxID=2697034 RepID=UPI001FB6C700|nr:phospholipase D-like domain-containing protein [Rubellimicrobium sp. CFH 75288]
MQHPTGLSSRPTRVEVLVTAAEAYPVLERAFLGARREIWASFRIFDLSTRLRSPEAQAVGETWFDLIVHTLRRGVDIRMVLTDFDPIARPSLHRGTWKAVRQFMGAAEAAGPGAGRLRITAAMHSAVTGVLPRTVFWPQIAARLRAIVTWLNGSESHARSALLRDMPGLRDWLVSPKTGPLRARLWGVPVLYPATHHQKLAVFDRRLLSIGGLDLDERRWDTPEHNRPGAETWHDVQLMVEGPIVAEAQAHLETFLDVVAGRADPPPQRKLLRTVSRRRSASWVRFGPEELLHEIYDAHLMLAARAERLIYLETQYFRDTRLARALAQLGRERPSLSLILILPAAPEEVAFGGFAGLDARFGEYLQARSLRLLEDGFGSRLFVGGAAQPRRKARRGDGPQAAGPEGSRGPETADEHCVPEARGRDRLKGAPIVYIHSKVSVFDDKAAIVSSANLNGRSMRWDTEAGLLLDDPAQVVALRERIMRHWLPRDPEPALLDPARAIGAWRNLALSNARQPPDRRRGFLLPYDLDAAERLGRSIPGVPEEMV